MSTKPVILTTIDRTEDFKKDLARLLNMDVLVGVPSDNADRRREINEDEDNTYNNAQLLALHTEGSPLQNLPARPVLQPAIEAEDNKEKLTTGMQKSAKLILDNQLSEANLQLHRVAMKAQNVARKWFVDPRNGWPPDKPATIRRKINKMSKKAKKVAIEAGDPLTRTLIDTGQLRKAIIGVVREKQ